MSGGVRCGKKSESCVPFGNGSGRRGSKTIQAFSAGRGGACHYPEIPEWFIHDGITGLFRNQSVVPAGLKSEGPGRIRGLSPL